MTDQSEFFSDFLNDQEESSDDGFDLEKLSQEFDEKNSASDPFQKRMDGTLDDSADQIDEQEEEFFDVNPTSILEAMLFVGSDDNRPLSAKEMSALMRGVTESDISELVSELNERYESEGSPYAITLENGGYRMVLNANFEATRNRFYREAKPAKLPQNVIDVLSLVAYLQPVTKATIDEKRLKSSGGILNQLVRRRLIKIERMKTENKKTQTFYQTTDRFLEMFGLDSIDELPKSNAFESDN